MLEGFTPTDYLLLASIGILAVVVFLAFFKKPHFKKDFYVKEGVVDKDVIMVYGGNGGAEYFSYVDKRTPIKVYHDGTVDIKLVDGTELKHVDLEENIKVIKTKGLLSGTVILACNIDGTNRVRDWITDDEIKARIKFTERFTEKLKAEGRDEILEMLGMKARYGGVGGLPFRPPGSEL